MRSDLLGSFPDGDSAIPAFLQVAEILHAQGERAWGQEKFCLRGEF
jgi:hypothetical protein